MWTYDVLMKEQNLCAQIRKDLRKQFHCRPAAEKKNGFTFFWTFLSNLWDAFWISPFMFSSIFWYVSYSASAWMIFSVTLKLMLNVLYILLVPKIRQDLDRKTQCSKLCISIYLSFENWSPNISPILPITKTKLYLLVDVSPRVF